MSEPELHPLTLTKTVAAFADMSPEASRLLQVWPVSVWQLGCEIDRITNESRWDVLAVSLPIERGPLHLESVDPETGTTVKFDRYQLYSYIELQEAS